MPAPPPEPSYMSRTAVHSRPIIDASVIEGSIGRVKSLGSRPGTVAYGDASIQPQVGAKPSASMPGTVTHDTPSVLTAIWPPSAKRPDGMPVGYAASPKKALPKTMRSTPKGLRGSSRTSWSKATTSSPPAPIETSSLVMNAGWNGVTAWGKKGPP